MMKEEKKIRFRDLSWWLKVGIVGGILYILFAIISFSVGFIEGILSA